MCKTISGVCRLKSSFYLFGLLNLLFPLATFPQTSEYSVHGVVIDESGKPIANAQVRLWPPFTGDGDDFVDSMTKTNLLGEFELVRKSPAGIVWHLYTEYMITGAVNHKRPLMQPYTFYGRRDRAFDGYNIRFGAKHKIDVGKVKINIWNGDLNLTILNNGKRLTSKQWDNLFYYVKNGRGKIVAGAGLGPTQSEVDVDNSKLKFALPVGRWKIELHKFDNDTNKISPGILAKTPFFEIRKNIAKINLQLQIQ